MQYNAICIGFSISNSSVLTSHHKTIIRCTTQRGRLTELVCPHRPHRQPTNYILYVFVCDVKQQISIINYYVGSMKLIFHSKCMFLFERFPLHILWHFYIMFIRNSHSRSIIHYLCCRLRGGIHDVVTLIVSRIKHADTTVDSL